MKRQGLGEQRRDTASRARESRQTHRPQGGPVVRVKLGILMGSAGDPHGIHGGSQEPAHRIPMGSVEGTQGTHGEFSVEVSSEFSGANMTGVNFRVNFLLMV